MSTQTLSCSGIVSRLPEDTVIICHGVSWDEYEERLEHVGKASGCATVIALKLNNLTARREWVSAGWHPANDTN
jgi:hypothetical protein